MTKTLKKEAFGFGAEGTSLPGEQRRKKTGKSS
jgi:hypothetical protein